MVVLKETTTVTREKEVEKKVEINPITKSINLWVICEEIYNMTSGDYDAYPEEQTIARFFYITDSKDRMGI